MMDPEERVSKGEPGFCKEYKTVEDGGIGLVMSCILEKQTLTQQLRQVCRVCYICAMTAGL